MSGFLMPEPAGKLSYLLKNLRFSKLPLAGNFCIEGVGDTTRVKDLKVKFERKNKV